MGSVSSRSQSLLVDALAAQALSLRTHYQETNDVKYLDHLISNEQAILKFLPERDTRRFETCTRLAHLRNDLDTRTGGESVLKRDVEQWRVLCAHNPVDHPLRVEAFSNLATALRKLYSHTNDIRLLDEATDIHREALALHLPGHPDRATSCSNLASSLSTRYDRTGDMRLLDEATELQREALALTPSGNPDYAPYCTNLAIFLESRHKQAGDTELLDEAIELKRKALAQFSSGDRDRAGFCTNLAYSLHTRYNETGDIGLLSEAIVLDREALHWQWPGDPDRAGCCTNLAVSLKALSMVTHDMRLLEEAISLDREALTLRPPSHPDHSLYCINLALSLERQYGHTKDDHLLEEAIDLSHEAADYSSPSRVWRSWTLQCHLYLRQRSTSNLAITRASSALQRCADLEADNITYFMDNIATELNSLWSFRPDWNCDIPSLLVSVYVDLVNRLPLIAAFVLNTSSRLLALQSFSHLGSQACVVAIEAGKFELALELLDHSHGVIWAQALHQRNPEFADAPSELASELDTLLRAINAPATTLSAGHLTSRDNQHVQNSRIYSILREIRAMPGLDRFMRGKAFDELRQVARTHPVALLVLIDNETYAVIVKDASQEHPDVLKLGVTSEQIVSLLGQTRQMGFSDRSSSEGEWREAWSEPLADLSEPHSSERYMLPQVSRQSFVGLRDIWNTIVKPIFIHVGLKVSCVTLSI
jgi:tetratricopeptide (TPR) repeat protein